MAPPAPPPFKGAGPPGPAGPNAAPEGDEKARWYSRKWVQLTATAVVALLIGGGLGAASGTSEIDELETENSKLTAKLEDANAALNDRDAQMEADQAAAERAKQEQAEVDAEAERKAAADKEAADKKAADEKAAADKAAADKAAADKKAADEAAAQQAAAADARRRMPGSGIFAVGPDIDPGQWRTAGPDGRSCYYAILSSPTASGIDNIIDNNNISGPGIVQLADGQFFETNGCQDWTLG